MFGIFANFAGLMLAGYPAKDGLVSFCKSLFLFYSCIICNGSLYSSVFRGLLLRILLSAGPPLFKNLQPISVGAWFWDSAFLRSRKVRNFQYRSARTMFYTSSESNNFARIKLKSLILAQIERWRHALHMQVERQHGG